MKIQSTKNFYNQQNFGKITINEKDLKLLTKHFTNNADWDKFEKIKSRAAKNNIVDVDLCYDTKNNLKAFIWQRDPQKHGWTPEYFNEPTINKIRKISPLQFIEEMVVEAERWTQKIQ